MTATPSAQLGILTYASPEVRTSPPRTILRLILAAIGWVFGKLLAALRLCVMASGYAVLGAGIVVRFAFALVAMVLLLVAGLRWDVVKRRTLGGAEWVDAKVLAAMGVLRRRLLPRGWSGREPVAP